MPPYMRRPTAFPQLIDKILWNGGKQKKMKTIFSRRAPRSRKEEKNTGFTSRVSGFRLLNFGSRFLTPDSWILFFPLFFPEMGEKGRPHDPFNISFFYGRSKENLEEAVWEEAKITPQREGDETLGGSCGFFRCRKKVFFPEAPPGRNKIILARCRCWLSTIPGAMTCSTRAFALSGNREPSLASEKPHPGNALIPLEV